MLTSAIEDGMIVERPDYSVLRVSLVDMGVKEREKLIRVIKKSQEIELATHAGASEAYIRMRSEAATRGEELKYVNVAGGKRGGVRLRKAEQYLRDQGFEAYLDVTKGPLLRATRGRLLTHMPLSKDSSYTHLIGALKQAWEISSNLPEPDLELDLEGLEEPKWAHHSLRRTSDRFARQSMDITGTKKEDLDDMYGWNQAARAKDMQLVYEGRQERSKRKRITMMI